MPIVPSVATATDPAALVLTGRPVQVQEEYSALVLNAGSETAWIGGADSVTDADGFPLEAGATMPVSGIGQDDELWAYANPDTELRVLEAR